MSCLTLQASALTFPAPPYSNTLSNDSQDNASKNISSISLLRKCRTFKEIPPTHANILKNGHQNDPFIVFELLRMCSKTNSINYAFEIFHHIREPNVYLYTVLIDGVVLSGLYLDSIRIYCQMVEDLILPDNYVISSVLKACGFQMELKFGREIHGQATKLGLCSNRSVKLRLIELYGKCREFQDAKRVFGEMPERDVVAATVMISCYSDHGLAEKAVDVFNLVRIKDAVCWTAMIDGLVRNGEMSKALKFFRRMQREGVRPNEVTCVCILSACAQLGALELGKWVHSYLEMHDIDVNHLVGSALITMYSRCGDIDEAERIFNVLRERDVTTYNSLIMGCALNGKSGKAVEMFQGMITKGIRPTNITFIGVLTACSHGGLVDLAFDIFDSMETKHGIEPEIEHCGCMVDLLGRVGHLEDAYKFIWSMKITSDHIIWGSLLSACRIHKHFDIGERVAQVLVDIGDADSATFILLSNFYAAQGKWEAAAQARVKLQDGGVRKEPGCSSIEVENEIHEFLLGDTRHPKREEIYKKLEDLNQMLRLKGYSPDTEVISQDIGDQEKKWALAIHSERLAICYGLISTKPHTTIRVVKNLRVCSDCHSAIKLITEITGRNIVLRDRNRFHHFENGICSCGDYW